MIKRLMLTAGWFPARRTARSDVASLIHELHPMHPARTASRSGADEAFLIRMGPLDDGGYLVPDDLDGITALFSPGTGHLTDFEVDAAARGMRVHAADGSIAPGDVPNRSVMTSFQQVFLGPHDDGEHVSMASWVSECEPGEEDDFMLQMDIEGGEYLTLVATPGSVLQRFRIIVLEVHDLSRLWDEAFFPLARAMFQKLNESHQVVHVHPNNVGGVSAYDGISIPGIAEFTYLRRDRLDGGTLQPAGTFPHPLDAPNSLVQPDLALPANWYRQGRGR